MSHSLSDETQSKEKSQASVRAEAERRAKFVRGMGGSVAGYCDGYADGFEHAAAWLLGKIGDPLAIDYRPSSGMSHSKNYYKLHPKERSRILDWFEKIAATPVKKSAMCENDLSR